MTARLPGLVSLSGDTAVVGSDEVVHVFERDPGGDHWVHSATLVASDGRSGFGKSVATDGNTTVVGGCSAQVPEPPMSSSAPGSQAWQETARLTGDVNASTFGASVAVSGTTIVVGAPYRHGLRVRDRVVFVFEEDEEGASGVRSRGCPASRFPGPRSPTTSVPASRLTPIPSSREHTHPRPTRFGSQAPLVYVFSRMAAG